MAHEFSDMILASIKETNHRMTAEIVSSVRDKYLRGGRKRPKGLTADDIDALFCALDYREKELRRFMDAIAKGELQIIAQSHRSGSDFGPRPVYLSNE